MTDDEMEARQAQQAMMAVADEYADRLAFMLECMIAHPNKHFDEACLLLDSYQAACERACPSPPTFMGEPLWL
jgi:hypothetical protein